jgi:hypothetical protein
MNRLCDDCRCEEGHLHDRFCTRERCPFCGNQLLSRGCITLVLHLTPEEQQALDAYEDDSVEPLRSIRERWNRALERKGRVPF